MREPSDIEDLLELTPFQAQVLDFRSRNPASVTWRTQSWAPIQGRLDLERLRAAVERIVGAHGILRTSFHSQNLSKPIQVIHRQAPLEFQIFEHGGQTSGDGLGAVLEADRRRSLPLSKPPLMRVAVRRVSEDAHDMVWTNDHLLLDGWSRSILMKEIAETYAGTRPAAEAKAASFGSYIRWLQEADAAAGLEMWQAQLEPLRSALPLLPARTQGPAVDDQQIVTASLPVDLLRGLQAKSALCRVTLNTLIQGAWALALRDVFGREGFAMGVVVSGRPPALPGVESIVGMLVNVACVAVEVPNISSEAWLSELDARQVDLREHEHVAPEQLRSALDLPPSHPFPDNVIRVQNFPRGRPNFLSGIDGLQVGRASWFDRWPYPLDLLVAPSSQSPEEGLRIQLTYSPAYVAAGQAQALVERLSARLKEP